ncbi:MAG: phage tail tube protein [Pseudomonadota bacterium]|nr:phage tail tube protein [Pseudomonadota bacterium]
MSYKAGKGVLLKVDFGQGAGFQTVGGIQTRRITLNDTSIDVTNQESEGNWAEMLAGVANKSIAVAGDGVFKAGPVMTQLIQAWLNQQSQGYQWQVIFPGLGIFEGPFTVGTLELSGDQTDVAKFSIAVASAGPIGFTPNTAAA